MSPAKTAEPECPRVFSVVLDGTTHSVEYVPGKTLLDCVIEAGLDAPFMCQEGHCGTCMSVLQSGEVRMLENHVLSQRDLDAGYVLACQSVPVSAAELLLDMDD